MAYSEASKRKYFATRAAVQKALTPAEKRLVAYYQLQWTMRQYVPTIEEVTEYVRKEFPTTRHTSINYYLNREPVHKALESRGINYLQHTQDELTPTQIAVAHVMCNFSDKRSNYEKLDAMGINTAQYNVWLNDPAFQNLVKTLADQNLKNISAAAITELTKKINDGDWQAIKYYLDTTGVARDNDRPNTEVMLRGIIEILQKHVKDPDVMTAIAGDLIRLSGNRTLTANVPPALDAEFSIDDEELKEAQKQLGFS